MSLLKLQSKVQIIGSPSENQDGSWRVSLYINDGSNNAKLLDLALNQDGIIRVRLNRRFIDLLAFPWPGEQDPNDVIIEVERPIL